MSLQIRISDLITSVGTDYKLIKTMITGTPAGDLTGLNTTNKTSLVAALNEVKVSAVGAPPAASETVAGVAEIATQLETTTGTDDARTISPLKLAQRLVSYLPPAASEIASGVMEIATQAETTTGTDDLRSITPLKLAQKLTAWAQPLNTNLTTLAGVVSGAFGRTLITSVDAASAKTSLGLATVATSGSASDITTGTLPSSVMPPLAINDVFTVVSQAAMLALTAQRGDVAIRTDVARSFILSTDSPATLADWKQITAGGDVVSVAGRTGSVVLTATDVGLANVNNTADASKPVSTLQAAADALALQKANNLSDLANVVTARTNLAVYSTTELGNPETDLVALYTTAKV
jgi:hypothetical protein